ncbi:MAG: DNA primase [Fusobacteria bacterium]|nr:DNA primase [Fusobacteriota bacterium]
MIYNNDDIEKLASELDIVKVIGEYIELKKQGISYRGLCPFHEEKTPSFYVTPSKNIYKCFGCGVGGNSIDFYMKHNNLNYIDAIKELSQKYDIAVRTTTRNEFSQEINKKKEIYTQILEDTLQIFKENIKSEKEIINYLNNRDINMQFINKYEIGYAKNSWNHLLNELKARRYELVDIIAAGVVKQGEKGAYDVFRDRVMFPIYSYSGKIIGFGGRTTEENKDIAKYLNSPESEIFKKGNNLYGLIDRGRVIRKNDYAILVEGYMDVISMHIYGFDMTVATLGTSLTENQAKLLKKYTHNIIIAYDMDEAGKKAIERAANILKKHDFNIRVLELEGAKDPDEFLKKYGRDKFIDNIKKSKEIFDFLYFYYLKYIDISNVIGKKKFIEKFYDFFLNLSNKIEYNIYLDKLSKNIDIDVKALEEHIKYNNKYVYKNIEKNNMIMKNRDEKLELLTLKLILQKKEYLNNFSNILFSNTFYRDIIESIRRNYNRDNLEYAIINDTNLEDYDKDKIIEIIYNIDIISDYDRYYEEIKKSWEFIQLKEEEKEIGIMLGDVSLTNEEKNNLIYKRVEIIKKIKNLF